ncbi:MAG: metallophosphoesterase [Rhodobacterales bacterium]|nr:metallophosphoesterase [Rhodobacterales bacterium]
MRTYAIGDIHGQLDRLRAAHARIAADRRETGDLEAPVVHVGDLVDRGPESAEVVEYLRRGSGGPEGWVVLKGNHDFMFNLFLTDPTAHDPGLRPDLDWLDVKLGGVATLASYGVADAGERPLAEVHAEALAKVPVAHRVFLEGLPLMHERGKAVFVHAGIRPGVPLGDQVPQDLTWIRKLFHDDRRDHGALIVHGHTVIPVAHHYGNRVNIDTGAAYGGPLTAVVIEGRDVWELTEAGRIRMPPNPEGPV